MSEQTRRDFLAKLGTLGAIGVSKAILPRWMPRMAFAQDANSHNGNIVICIFLRGGIDGLTAVVPYGEGRDYYDKRPTQFVPEPGRSEGSAIDLDGFFGLHPAMRPLKEVYDAGDLAIVHATGSTDPTRSHFDAMLYMEYGTPGNKLSDSGWLGRHLQSAAWQNDSPFRAVGFGAMLPDSLQGYNSALALESIAQFHFRGRPDEVRRIQQALAQLYTINAPAEPLDQQAQLVFQTMDQLRALSATEYEPANGADYPENPYGMGLRQIAQLIKANVGLEIACVDFGGWDTHETQGTLDGEFALLLSALTQGLHALYTDLGDTMQRVTVVTMSEFGRTVRENGSAGTDHGHGNFMMLMGGNVQGGRVYGEWPSLQPAYLSDGDLAITTDYRHVLAEVLSKHLGNNDLGYIFPNFAPNDLGLIVP